MLIIGQNSLEIENQEEWGEKEENLVGARGFEPPPSCSPIKAGNSGILG